MTFKIGVSTFLFFVYFLKSHNLKIVVILLIVVIFKGNIDSLFFEKNFGFHLFDKLIR